MAAYGRGRGLGRGRGRGICITSSGPTPGSLNNEDAVEAGEKSVSKAGGVDINMVSSLVQGLNLDTTDLTSVLNATVQYGNSEAHLEEILRILYIKVMQDWRSSKQMADICSKLVQLPDLGVKFRTSLLRRIQLDFGSRVEAREEKPRTYLACMAFLCQVFCQVRSATHEPFRPLVTPVYSGLEMLLDSRAKDTEIEIAVVQLMDLGPLLEKYDEVKMKNLMQLVKEKIIEAEGTKDSRRLLLQLIEIYAAGWRFRDSCTPSSTSTSQALPTVTQPVTKDRTPTSPIASPNSHTNTSASTQRSSYNKTSPGSPKKVSFKESKPIRGSGWGNMSSRQQEESQASGWDDGWDADPPKNDNDAGEWQNPT